MDEDELKQQLTAAEEQLAEMREALEAVEWIDDTSYGPGCPFCWQARENGHDEECGVAKALSAARKRGRVIWQGTGTWYPDKTLLIRGLNTSLLWTSESGQEATITVREAEHTCFQTYRMSISRRPSVA